MMKKVLLCLALMFGAGLARAVDTITPRFKLVQPGIGTLGWGVKINDDWLVMDSTAACLYCYNGFTSTNSFSGDTLFPNQSIGQIVYIGANGKASFLAAGTTGQVLISGGNAAPTWGGSAGGVAIGGTVSGGTANYVPFIDSTGELAQDIGFQYFPSSGNLASTGSVISPSFLPSRVEFNMTLGRNDSFTGDSGSVTIQTAQASASTGTVKISLGAGASVTTFGMNGVTFPPTSQLNLTADATTPNSWSFLNGASIAKDYTLDQSTSGTNGNLVFGNYTGKYWWHSHANLTADGNMGHVSGLHHDNTFGYFGVAYTADNQLVDLWQQDGTQTRPFIWGHAETKWQSAYTSGLGTHLFSGTQVGPFIQYDKRDVTLFKVDTAGNVFSYDPTGAIYSQMSATNTSGFWSANATVTLWDRAGGSYLFLSSAPVPTGSLLMQIPPSGIVSMAPSSGYLALTGTFIPSAGILGVSDAGAATAGTYGETISTTSTGFTNVASTGQFGNVVSQAVTAGDWTASGCVTMSLNSAVMTDYEVAISSFSANTTTDHVEGKNWLETAAFPISTAKSTLCVPAYPINLAGTTTMYLKVKSAYSAATPQAIGTLTVRRGR